MKIIFKNYLLQIKDMNRMLIHRNYIEHWIYQIVLNILVSNLNHLHRLILIYLLKFRCIQWLRKSTERLSSSLSNNQFRIWLDTTKWAYCSTSVFYQFKFLKIKNYFFWKFNFSVIILGQMNSQHYWPKVECIETIRWIPLWINHLHEEYTFNWCNLFLIICTNRFPFVWRTF